MKHQGNVSDFKDDRDRDLHRSFMEVLRDSEGVALRDMFALAAKRPSRRFWVSEGRAAIVIGAMLNGKSLERMIPERRDMFEEIHRRVVAKMKADPGLCLTHAVNETVYEPAPRFFLTPESTRSIIYRYRRRRKEGRP